MLPSRRLFFRRLAAPLGAALAAPLAIRATPQEPSEADRQLESVNEELAYESALAFREAWNQWIVSADLRVLNTQSVVDFRKVKKAWKTLEQRFATLGYK